MPEAAQHLLSCWSKKNGNTSSELVLLLRALIRTCHSILLCFTGLVEGVHRPHHLQPATVAVIPP